LRILCGTFGLTRTGYYAWLKRGESKHSRDDQRLALIVKEVHQQSRGTYGSPRIHRELKHRSEQVGIRRVRRIMRENGLFGRGRKRFKNTTRPDPTLPAAPNRLQQDCESEWPNQKWVEDTTELLLDHGKIYLAVVMDLYARFIVGWALSRSNDRHLVIAAKHAALLRRQPGAGLISHMDRGSTYASRDHRSLLDRYQLVCSMSGTGNCFDNAAMESWFATLKLELGEKFIDEEDARRKLFDYIEIFYNQQRLHSSLDYRSPAEKERWYHSDESAQAA
jgi:putative transposase